MPEKGLLSDTTPNRHTMSRRKSVWKKKMTQEFLTNLGLAKNSRRMEEGTWRFHKGIFGESEERSEKEVSGLSGNTKGHRLILLAQKKWRKRKKKIEGKRPKNSILVAKRTGGGEKCRNTRKGGIQPFRPDDGGNRSKGS